MAHDTGIGRIWVFDEGKLESALADYQAEALAAYPEQKQLIQTTVAAMRDLLHSPHADKLVLGASVR